MMVWHLSRLGSIINDRHTVHETKRRAVYYCTAMRYYVVSSTRLKCFAITVTVLPTITKFHCNFVDEQFDNREHPAIETIAAILAAADYRAKAQINACGIWMLQKTAITARYTNRKCLISISKAAGITDARSFSAHAPSRLTPKRAFGIQPPELWSHSSTRFLCDMPRRFQPTHATTGYLDRTENCSRNAKNIHTIVVRARHRLCPAPRGPSRRL